MTECVICDARTGAEEIVDYLKITLKLLPNTEKNYRTSNRVVDAMWNAIINGGYCRLYRDARWLL